MLHGEAPISGLLEQLDLEVLDHDLFRGLTPDDGRPRVYGGLVAAQALVAAGRTVGGELLAHSLHAYFLRPGDPKRPIIYEVDRIREGRSFTTRRVVAIQAGEAIFNLAASFQVPQEGLDHAVAAPEAPPPGELKSSVERLEGYVERSSSRVFPFLLRMERPIEHRPVDHVDHLEPTPHRGLNRLWFRADGEIGDDPLMHQAVLTYASDSGLLDASLHYHGRTWLDRELMLASLDHAVWFHRPFRLDGWMLYATDSPSAGGGRSFNRGAIHTGEGTLVASVAQEALVRFRRKG